VAIFLEQGGNFILTAPKPPYRCPPAPYERACMIAERMKEKGTKGKIILVDASPHPMPQPIAKPLQAAMQQLYADQIEYITNADLKSVDANKKILVTSKGDIKFQHANIVLPMRAPALIRQAGLGQRWADIKLPSFQSQADPNVFVIGDSQGAPLPKSGHVAFGAGQMVAEQIVAMVAGTYKAPELGDQVTLPTGICWGKVSRTQAIMINVYGSIEVGQPPQLKYQIDPAHNASSSKGAMEWGKQMWGSMLGA
jgi:sulfide dehydrogenase [flavocytochrome c] flavoprotein subunit